MSTRACGLAGQAVKAGQRVNIPIYAMHRHVLRWPDPDADRPERFSAETARPSRFAYLPFGAGPRICIGAAFAMAEAITVIATLVQKARFTLLEPQTVWPQTGLALTPRDGLRLSVKIL